jgi:hypothetical protein
MVLRRNVEMSAPMSSCQIVMLICSNTFSRGTQEHHILHGLQALEPQMQAPVPPPSRCLSYSYILLVITGGIVIVDYSPATLRL